VPANPATSVRGPKYGQREGVTPVLAPDEARQLLNAIDVSTIAGLRDRALIGLMVYSFARIGAAVTMQVEDVYVQNRRLWVRLHEKGGKLHKMPCHRTLEAYLDATSTARAFALIPRGPSFVRYGAAPHVAPAN
jgi:site-specific recombinase XerC